jgi:hypothetical protein
MKSTFYIQYSFWTSRSFRENEKKKVKERPMHTLPNWSCSVPERIIFKSVSQIPRQREVVKILEIEYTSMHGRRQLFEFELWINYVKDKEGNIDWEMWLATAELPSLLFFHPELEFHTGIFFSVKISLLELQKFGPFSRYWGSFSQLV